MALEHSDFGLFVTRLSTAQLDAFLNELGVYFLAVTTPQSLRSEDKVYALFRFIQYSTDGEIIYRLQVSRANMGACKFLGVRSDTKRRFSLRRRLQ